MNSDTSKVDICFLQNKLSMNDDKTAILEVYKEKVSIIRIHKYFGLIIDENKISSDISKNLSKGHSNHAR